MFDVLKRITVMLINWKSEIVGVQHRVPAEAQPQPKYRDSANGTGVSIPA
jgi:hypothetical protein